MADSKKGSRLAKKLDVQRQLRELGQRHIKSSFEHLDTEHHKFLLSDCSEHFLRHHLQTMAQDSRMTVEDFRLRDDQHRRHPISFEETTEQEGFGLDPIEVGSDEAYQFGLCDDRLGSTGTWRVHGFLRGNVFHVRWLDHSHRLCTDENRLP